MVPVPHAARLHRLVSESRHDAGAGRAGPERVRADQHVLLPQQHGADGGLGSAQEAARHLLAGAQEELPALARGSGDQFHAGAVGGEGFCG